MDPGTANNPAHTLPNAYCTTVGQDPTFQAKLLAVVNAQYNPQQNLAGVGLNTGIKADYPATGDADGDSAQFAANCDAAGARPIADMLCANLPKQTVDDCVGVGTAHACNPNPQSEAQ
jgi:hypothetical protein